MLNWKHDYYVLSRNRIALTGAEFCDFFIWTEADVHIERILLDVIMWAEMKAKLARFYYTTLGIEVFNRLCNM